MNRSKRKSLLNSILLSSIAALVGATVMIVVLFTAFVSPGMLSKSKSEVYYRVAEQSSDMNAWITKHTTIAENLALAARVDNIRGERLRTYLHECILNVSPSIMDCYVAWEDEAPRMMCAVFVPAADYVPQQRGWYKAAVEANGTIITDPYIDAFTGKIVITVASLVKDENGKRTGCVGLDIDVTELVEIANDMHADKNGYAILTDASGNIVVDARHENNSHRLSGEDEVVTAVTDVLPLDKDLSVYSEKNIKNGSDKDGMSCFFPVVELGDTGWNLIYAADYSEMQSDHLTANIMIIAAGVIMMAAGAAFLKIKFTGRLKPVQKLVAAVDDMSAGNFRMKVDCKTNDEIGSLSDSINRLCENTNGVIEDLGYILGEMEQGNLTARSRNEAVYTGDYLKIITSVRNFREKITMALDEINTASQQVLEGAELVAGDAQALSQGTSRQSDSVDELTGTIGTIGKQINFNAEYSKDAMRQTNASVNEMNSATQSMNQLVAAMNDIKDCSDKISDIIRTIEDISFQTNILALNASIEAARAGEAGKGFAVVADEVRNLAGKSAEASANTNVLIENTVSAVERGNKLVSEVAEVMTQVGESSQRCAELNTRISEGSADTVSYISQLSGGIEQISSVVQTNSETAQQSAAAAEELSSQANMLKTLVGQFKVK